MKIYTAKYKVEVEVDVAAKSRGEVEAVVKGLDMGKLVADFIGEYVPDSLEVLTIKESEIDLMEKHPLQEAWEKL